MIVAACVLSAVVLAVWLTAKRQEVKAYRYVVASAIAMAVPNIYLLANQSELSGVAASTIPLIVLCELLWGVGVYAVCRRNILEKSAPTPRKRSVRYLEPIGGLALLLIGAAGAQSIWEGTTSVVSLTFLGAGVAALAWATTKPVRQVAMKYLASAEAAAVVLGAIMMGTVVGTLVLQGVGPAEFDARYGPLADPLRALHANDIFRSVPFAVALFLLGLTSVLTAYRRRKSLMQWKHFGLMMSHVAVVAILIGAFVGALWGEKGMVHLEVGKGATTFLSSTRDGSRGETKPLGFTLRLDNFHLDNYDPVYRFYTYNVPKDGSDSQLVASEDAIPGEEVGLVGEDADGVKVTVERVFHSYGATTTWVADPAAAGAAPAPAARLQMQNEGASAAELWLTPSVTRAAPQQEPRGRFALQLDWDAPSDAELLALAQANSQTSHQLQLPGGSTLNVAVGQNYPLPDGRTLRVRKYLPDFTYDIATKTAKSRSNRPVNPALEIAIAGAGEGIDVAPGRLLFARSDIRDMMKQAGHDQSEGFLYSFHAAAPTVDKLVIIAASSSERLEVVKGKLASREPITWGVPFSVPNLAEGVTLSVDQPLRNAKPQRAQGEVAGGDPNPAVAVLFTKANGATGRTVLLGNKPQPMRISDERVLTYREKPGKIRNFESTLSVISDGVIATSETIKVNHPLSYGGFIMYQSNYDENRPTYSGIQVVKDPGLFLVEAGLWILMFGVLQTVLMRSWQPVWRRRPKSSRKKQSDKTAEVVA